MSARWLLGAALLGSSALAQPGGEWLAGPAPAPARLGSGAVEERSQKLRDELGDLKQRQRAREALTIARGRAYVRLARAGLLPASGGLEAFARHTSRLERLRRALGRDLAEQRQLSRRRAELARAIEELDNLAPAERRALARAQSAVEAAQERDQAFARAFQSDWSAPRRTTVYGARPVSPPRAAPAESGFAARRGRLPFPVAGRAEIQRVTSPTGAGQAVLLLSAPGTPVRAVHAARVAFADDYPELGKTVILDHGEGYYSVSAHLERISVEVGQELQEGERIGSVGAPPGQAGLLFEVRAGQNALNTSEWFGI